MPHVSLASAIGYLHASGRCQPRGAKFGDIYLRVPSNRNRHPHSLAFAVVCSLLLLVDGLLHASRRCRPQSQLSADERNRSLTSKRHSPTTCEGRFGARHRYEQTCGLATLNPVWCSCCERDPAVRSRPLRCIHRPPADATDEDPGSLTSGDVVHALTKEELLMEGKLLPQSSLRLKPAIPDNPWLRRWINARNLAPRLPYLCLYPHL